MGAFAVMLGIFSFVQHESQLTRSHAMLAMGWLWLSWHYILKGAMHFHPEYSIGELGTTYSSNSAGDGPTSLKLLCSEVPVEILQFILTFLPPGQIHMLSFVVMLRFFDLPPWGQKMWKATVQHSALKCVGFPFENFRPEYTPSSPPLIEKKYKCDLDSPDMELGVAYSSNSAGDGPGSCENFGNTTLKFVLHLVSLGYSLGMEGAWVEPIKRVSGLAASTIGDGTADRQGFGEVVSTRWIQSRTRMRWAKVSFVYYDDKISRISANFSKFSLSLKNYVRPRKQTLQGRQAIIEALKVEQLVWGTSPAFLLRLLIQDRKVLLKQQRASKLCGPTAKKGNKVKVHTKKLLPNDLSGGGGSRDGMKHWQKQQEHGNAVKVALKAKLYGKDWNSDVWYRGVEWLTGVDMTVFCKRQSSWYSTFVPMLGIQVVSEQLYQMWLDYSHHVQVERHPSLIIMNTGSHWVLGNVHYEDKSVHLWDSYPQNHKVTSVQRLIQVLENNDWTVTRTGLAVQNILDSNTCGFHVLQWVKQLDSCGGVLDSWRPTPYNLQEWVERVYQIMNYEVGAAQVRDKGSNVATAHTQRKGPAVTRRERYRNWVSQVCHLGISPSQSSRPPGPTFRSSNVVQLPSSVNNSMSDRSLPQWNDAWKSQILLSHNVASGLHNPSKLRSMLSYCMQKQPMAVMLQEIGFNMEDIKSNYLTKMIDQYMSGYDLWTCVDGDRRHSGVGTILPRQFTPLIKQDKIIRDSAGRFLAIPCQILHSAHLLWFVNIYSPVSLEKTSMQKIEFYGVTLRELQAQLFLNSSSMDLVIVGMDANATINPRDDVQWEQYAPECLRQRLSNLQKDAGLLCDWMDSFQVHDVWRQQYPHKRVYTRVPYASTTGNLPTAVPKRIDYILTNQNVDPFVSNSGIINNNSLPWSTDHCMLSIELVGIPIIITATKQTFQRTLYHVQNLTTEQVQAIQGTFQSFGQEEITQVEKLEVKMADWMKHNVSKKLSYRSFRLQIPDKEYKDTKVQLKYINHLFATDAIPELHILGIYCTGPYFRAATGRSPTDNIASHI